MAKIVVTIPGGRRKTYILDENQTIIGRSPKCSVVIDDKKASREHLKIQMIADVITAEDLGSSNGTMFLNQRITKKTIDDRDILTIGDVKVQFFFDNNADPDIALSKKKRSFEQAASENQLVEINPDGSVLAIDGDFYFIEILDGDFRGLKIKLDGKLTIGRHQQNILVLTGAKVSSQHAIIDFLGDETYITDLGSTNGTLVNTRKIDPNYAFRLSHGAIIEIGEHRISFNVPENRRPSEDDIMAIREEELSVLAAHSLMFVGGFRNGERIPMSKRLTIGRKDFNNICIPSQEVSGEHCEIFYEDNHFIVKDVDSDNGTFVNGKKIKNYKVLSHGDMISLGDTMLVFDQAGISLNIDDKIKNIKSWSSSKIQKSLIFSVVLLVLALIGLYILTDLTLEFLENSKKENRTNVELAKINSGIVFDDKFEEISELSFEFDPEFETKIPGWDLFIHNRGCDFTFSTDFVNDGKYSLEIIPKQTNEPRSEIRLTTNNQLNIKMKRAMELKALEISAQVSAQQFSGVLGIRMIWHTQLNPKIETVKFFDSNQFKSGVFNEIKCSVEIPNDVVNFGIQLFIRGNCSKIWFDKLRIQKANSFEKTIFDPIIFEEVQPTPDATASNVISLSLPKPMYGVVNRGNLNVISGISPVLINSLSYIGNSNLNDNSNVYSTSMGLEDNPAMIVTKLNNNSYVYSLQLYSDLSKTILPMTVDYTRKEDYYEIIPDLSNINLDERECIALRMDLMSPNNVNPKFHLRLFEANESSYIFLKESATIENVSEICWGNYAGYTGIRINPEATIYINKQAEGYEVYILLKGLKNETGNPRIQFYGYSTFEHQLKVDALRSGMKMLLRKENYGNVLIMAQRIIKAFESDTEFSVKVNKELNFNVLNNEQQTLFNRVNTAWQYIQTKDHTDTNLAIDTINDGIKAAEEFILKYSALYKHEEVKDKLRDLRNEKPKYMQLLTNDDKQKRLDDAQELLYRAKKFLDEQSSDYSLLQAMLFLDALINKYLPVVQVTDEIDAKLNLVIDDAILQKREIEKIWNNHEAEAKYIEAKIAEIKKALENEKFMEAQEIVKRIFLKYPFTKYRDEVEGLLYGN